MSTIEPSGVGQCEDPDQPPILGNKRAAEVVRRQMIEDVIERLTDVDDVGIRNKNIADEQLLFRREPEAGIERSLEVAVCQHTEQRVPILHREMTNLVLDLRALAASTLSSTCTTNGNGVMTEPIEGIWSMAVKALIPC